MPPTPATSRSRIIPIMLAQGIGLVCGLVSVRLNSHFIPPALLGFYGVFLSFTPLGMWVVHAGLIKFVSRHWAGTDHRHALAREVLGVWFRRLIWLGVCAAIAAGFTASLTNLNPAITWLLLVISAALLTISTLAQAALQAVRAHWADCGVSATLSLFRSFIPPFLYSAVGSSLSLLAGFTLHTVIGAIVGLWAAQTTLGDRPPHRESRSELGSVYEGPLFTALAISSWAISSINRWLVAWFYGEHEAGYFTLTGGAAVIVTAMVGTAIMQYLQPTLFALGDKTAPDHTSLARKVDLAALSYGSVAAVLLASAWFIAPFLVGPLISETYRDALVWIVPAGCFGITTMTAIFYHTMLLAGRRERACGPVDLTTAAVLAVGCIVTSALSRDWFMGWLIVSPVVPWLLTRTLARRYLLKPV